MVSFNPNLQSSRADGIFANMDKNNDGIVSQEESSAFGFSIFGKVQVTKEQFRNAYSSYAEKSSTLKGSLEDFSDAFFNTSDTRIIHDVSLSDTQRKELLSRIEMFEAYKSSLSQEEAQELEKNKKSTLDFALEKGCVDKDYKGYNNFIKKYNEVKSALKSGKAVNITNEELSQIIRYTANNDTKSDGQIGSFNQGRVGSCWFLSMLNNYVSTPEGAQNIKNRIKDNKDGSYTVTFDNPFDKSKKDEYTISKEELENFDIQDKDYSSGDVDTRIMEISTNKMLKKYLLDKDVHDKDTPIADGDIIKQALVHKALGYDKDIITYAKGEDYRDCLSNQKDTNILQKFYNYLFGGGRPKCKANDEIYELRYNLSRVLENGEEKAKIDIVPTPTGETSFSRLIAKNGYKPEDMTIGSSANEYIGPDKGYWQRFCNWLIGDNIIDKEQRYISTGHAYNVMEVDENGMVINDPYASAFPHAIGNETVDNATFSRLTYIPR